MENDNYTPPQEEQWIAGESPAYNEVELERIDQYNQMLRLVVDTETKLANGDRTAMVWRTADGSKKDQYLFTVDEYFLEGMKHAANSLRNEYSDRGHMVTAFDDIENTILEEKAQAEEFEKLELEAMWKNGK